MNYPEVIYEDADLVVINKPAGWVVHLGAGETGETISDWFVKNYPEVMEHDWSDLTRVGIVHRLDKDTSGVLLLAKSPEILALLQIQFKERLVKKTYDAFIFGAPNEPEGTIETFLGRHPKHRQQQAVLPISHRSVTRRIAITDYKITQVYSLKGQTIAEIVFSPRTGRMHQLRVHAKYLGTPILGDQTYTIKPAKRLSKVLNLNRQMLHAASLTILHPVLDTEMTFEAPLPHDMVALRKQLAPVNMPTA